LLSIGFIAVAEQSQTTDTRNNTQNDPTHLLILAFIKLRPSSSYNALSSFFKAWFSDTRRAIMECSPGSGESGS
jgi:hypothetical protein